MLKTYLIYAVRGYEFHDKEKDLDMYSVNIDVIAKNEKEAIEKAQKMIKKPCYRVTGCYEKIVEK